MVTTQPPHSQSRNTTSQTSSLASVTADDGEPPLVDLATLERLQAELVEVAPELFQELIHYYMLNTPQMLATLRQASIEVDAEILNRTAHTLKSNSARLGAYHCSDLCQTLELMGEAHQFTGALETLAKLETAFSKTQAILSDT